VATDIHALYDALSGRLLWEIDGVMVAEHDKRPQFVFIKYKHVAARCKDFSPRDIAPICAV
jgi:hypothetical protein